MTDVMATRTLLRHDDGRSRDRRSSGYPDLLRTVSTKGVRADREAPDQRHKAGGDLLLVRRNHTSLLSSCGCVD